MCSDVIPISSWKKAEAKVLACKTPPKPWWKPWHKPKQNCKMTTDLSEVPTFQREAARKALEEKSAKKTSKKTTTTKEK